MSVVGASGHARNIFFAPVWKQVPNISAQRVYTVVLYPSCASYKSLLRKPYINLTVGVQAGLVIFFFPIRRHVTTSAPQHPPWWSHTSELGYQLRCGGSSRLADVRRGWYFVWRHMTETELPLNCVAQREDCLDGLSFCSNVQQT